MQTLAVSQSLPTNVFKIVNGKKLIDYQNIKYKPAKDKTPSRNADDKLNQKEESLNFVKPPPVP